MQGYHIKDAPKIGNLMEAIHGVRHTGFIGELYKMFPFPKKPENFKQKPEGVENQASVREAIEKYGSPTQIPLSIDESKQEVSIGEYRFTRDSFQALIRYVGQGGYPRWRNEVGPDYIVQFKQRVETMICWLFEGL